MYILFFPTAIVPKKSSIKGAFSDKHGPRFRQTWSIPTMYPNFGNIGHVSRFWIHCYFWPISDKDSRDIYIYIHIYICVNRIIPVPDMSIG